MGRRSCLLVVLIAGLALSAGCGQPVAVDESPPTVSRMVERSVPSTPPEAAPVDEPPAHPVPAYGVSAGHPAAVDVGMTVLAAGGNAVDAAIATAYAVGVAEPFGSGIGGGGAALVVEQGRDPVAYDYRDVVNRSGDIPASEVGIAVGFPSDGGPSGRGCSLAAAALG